MAKRKNETEEERKERKKLKKMAKKRKRQQESAEVASSDHETTSKEHLETSFVRKNLEMTVSLLPAALSDVQKGVEDSLRSLLLRYTDGLDGVLLAFDKTKVMDKGRILNDLPYLHYRVSAETLAFCPRSGCKLKGTITETFPSHLSLVVMHYFNASIPAEQMKQTGFEFDASEDCWVSTNDPNVTLRNENTVVFSCDRIHESAGIISIVGSQPKPL